MVPDLHWRTDDGRYTPPSLHRPASTAQPYAPSYAVTEYCRRCGNRYPLQDLEDHEATCPGYVTDTRTGAWSPPSNLRGGSSNMPVYSRDSNNQRYISIYYTLLSHSCCYLTSARFYHPTFRHFLPNMYSDQLANTYFNAHGYPREDVSCQWQTELVAVYFEQF
jgi:hypothetical protein